MNLGQRLNRVLAELFMQQEGAVSNFDPKPGRARGGHGAQPEQSHAPGGNSRPLLQQWSERFERMIERAEVDAGSRRADEAVPRHAKRSELRQRIHEYEGMDPVEVAFFERCSLDTVIRARKDAKVNVRTGERVRRDQRVLTASARDSLQLIQNTIGGEL